ncbi:hypothetical protein [Oceanibacterium hippocampi]|uniref:Cell division protein FtsL n=1 Tax=Oceanibacterium hippocampi TaxID=745714 RepID=A0A1Y5S3D2_9PROT|nr:hypothetical protein [Oceanibacterium hippocampi]SLN31692.1 hypothetical protein OCH7691_01138 [Oceanibacterium hippocampi]
MSEPARAHGPFERHLQTLVGFVLCGLIGWVGVSVADGREAVARVEERVSYLAETVRDLKQEIRAATRMERLGRLDFPTPIPQPTEEERHDRDT